MSKALELRKKRAELWEKAKTFLDNAKRDGDVLSAEDTATYEKMEQDIVALGKEIDILERREALELELSKPTTKPIVTSPETLIDTKIGRASEKYAKAFWSVMRNKTPNYDVFDALQIGTDSEGGFLVPDEFEKTLIDALADTNIFRNLSRVLVTDSGDRLIPVVSSHGEASWTAEESPIPESDDSFGQITLGAHKVATMIKVSEELLNDSVFSLDNYITVEFARRIGAAEEAAFISGDGKGKPTGIISSASEGVTAAASAAITFDEVIDLFYSLRAPYRKNASFIMNDSTVKVLRKLKDNDGQYIWQPSVKEGEPDKILNKSVYTSVYMPAIGASNVPILFGDYSYYWIADRQGRNFKRLSELYAPSGQVGFLATQRVDGKLTLPEAVKKLTMKSA